MKIIFLLFVIGGVLAGCGSGATVNDPHLIIDNDFENISGWVPEAQTETLTQERAHSGKYSIKVDSAHEFGLTFNKPLRQVFTTQPGKIVVSAWALISAPQAAASLVVSINNPDAPNTRQPLWSAIELRPLAQPPGEWVKVSRELEVPRTVGPNYRLNIYLWNTNRHPVYLDDLVVRQE